MSKSKVLQQLKQFKEAAAALVVEWSQEEDLDLTANYPFEKSFDEVVHDIIDWANAVENGKGTDK